MSKTSSVTIIARCTQRQAAATKYVPASGTITVHSQPYTLSQVEAVYQASIDTRRTLVNLRGQVAAAMTAKTQADATTATFDEGMRDWVATTFGPTSQQSVDFGYTKKAPAEPTAAVKAAAQVKAKATRTVRGTVGPKARLKVTVASVAAEPAAAPSAPTATAPAAAPGTATKS